MSVTVLLESEEREAGEVDGFKDIMTAEEKVREVAVMWAHIIWADIKSKAVNQADARAALKLLVEEIDKWAELWP